MDTVLGVVMSAVSGFVAGAVTVSVSGVVAVFVTDAVSSQMRMTKAEVVAKVVIRAAPNSVSGVIRSAVTMTMMMVLP